MKIVMIILLVVLVVCVSCTPPVGMPRNPEDAVYCICYRDKEQITNMTHEEIHNYCLRVSVPTLPVDCDRAIGKEVEK